MRVPQRMIIPKTPLRRARAARIDLCYVEARVASQTIETIQAKQVNQPPQRHQSKGCSHPRHSFHLSTSSTAQRQYPALQHQHQQHERSHLGESSPVNAPPPVIELNPRFTSVKPVCPPNLFQSSRSFSRCPDWKRLLGAVYHRARPQRESSDDHIRGAR